MNNTVQDDITKVTDQIIKELEANNHTKADRLQQVLIQLVKIRVAEIDSSRLVVHPNSNNTKEK